MTKHCTDNKKDRNIGAYWERAFCDISADYGLILTPLQIGREQSAQAYSKDNGRWELLTLPDITIWSADTEHHEIKHKNPTYRNEIGLEVYRFNALKKFRKITGHNVMYTIHNHNLNNGRDNKNNDIAHWLTCSVEKLINASKRTGKGKSWVGGVPKDVDIIYWNYSEWKPLQDWFYYRMNNKAHKI